ncbi:273_t:CDS:2 [Entrophospora sp. SA101]|nr:273_t:CDS:2 [Entrophospora sp. SA101]
MSKQNNSNSGRKLNEVWNFFTKTPLKSAGHFSAKCIFCNRNWGRAYVKSLQAHLSNDCVECPNDIRNFYLGVLSTNDNMSVDDNLSSNSRIYFSIQGGGLKTCIKTRWISIFESTNSIVRMRQALEEVVIKYPDEIKSRPVKKILKKQGFFEEVASLSQILLPIKNTIKILESDNSTLADVFIQMIRLAFKLKNINVGNMIELKRHSICAFNKRWDIGIKTGQYKLIVEAAREIWKSIDSSLKSEEILLSQMRKYKLKISPYDNDYVFLNETPKIWWLSVDDPHKNLQKLALLMYDITPHSAACERVFSTLGWIYNKNRLRLAVSKVEENISILVERFQSWSAFINLTKLNGNNISKLAMPEIVSDSANA